MILRSARLAASQLLEPGFRAVLLKSLGLTLLLLLLAWLGLEALVSELAGSLLGSWPWVARALTWLTGAGLLIGLGFLIGPAAAAFAGIFLDDVASQVESRHYRHEPSGAAMDMVPSMVLAAKFTSVVIVANAVALLLVLLPFVNFAVFFFVNAYLLAREYFQFAAMRFRTETDARRMAKAWSLEIFLSGMVIAGFMAIPLVNLLTPLFATAMMVHVHKALGAREAQSRRDAHGTND